MDRFLVVLSNVEPYFLEQEVQLPLVCVLSLINYEKVGRADN
jgi:hypothetical protein